MEENNPYEKFVNQKIKIVQKDGFIKSFHCTGYNEVFLFGEFNDGTPIAISFDIIDEIKILEGERE